jgi:[acyl-carrier-protein] S-malonyltransferase
MKEYAFLFPGQGSQVVGMGKDLHEKTDFGKKIFKQADEILGYNFSKLCFEGPQEELKLTCNTQPALLTVSYIIYNLLEQQPAIAAGHSLGEYSALCCAGALKFEDAIMLVHKRGTYMQEAVPVGKGSMAALIGPSIEEVTNALSEVEGVVNVANHNSAQQIVISGEKDAVEAAVTRVNAKRSIFLNVSAPFHSTLMMPAQEKLAVDLKNTEFFDLKFPVVNNVKAEKMTDKDVARESLILQVSNPVLWYKTMQYFLGNKKIENYAEIGSGKVLSGLIRRSSKDFNMTVKALSFSDLESVQTLKW